MRRNPERTAWAVLTAALLVFCLLLYLIPAGAGWLAQNAAVEQAITLARSNTVYVQRPGRTTLEANLTDVPVGSFISTEPNAEASLTFTNRRGETIAALDIFGDSQLRVVRAESPRFEQWSTAPHRIELDLTKGRLRLFTVADGGRDLEIHILSAPGAATRVRERGANVSVEASFVQTTVTVREGRADVAALGQTLTLTPDQRAEVGLDSPPAGPLSVERDLIRDGDFAADLGAVWQKDIFKPVIAAESPGLVAKTTLAGRPAVNFSRLGGNWGQAGLIQEINADVRGFSSLRLQLDVFLAFQSLNNCGSQGTECPVMVKVKYVDVSGAEREWLQGFYYQFNADPNFGLTFCGPCSPRYADHLLVEQNQWKPYESGNLLELWRAAGVPATVVKSIALYASGHSFDSNVAQVQLLVSD